MKIAKENQSQMVSYFHHACAVMGIGLCLSVLLAACGGGDGHTGASLTGKVLDGYIGGATVCLSQVSTTPACDGSISAASAVTDASGNYSFSFPTSTSLTGRHIIALIPAGATDVDATSGVVQTAYAMLAPAETPSVVSPLTTMVSENMLIHPASGIAAAQANVASTLGITTGTITSDYIASGNAGSHNTAKLVAGLLTSLGSSPTANQTEVNAIFTAAGASASAAQNATSSTQLNTIIATAQAAFTAAGGTVSKTSTYATAFNSVTNLTSDGGTLGVYSFNSTTGTTYEGGAGASSTYWYGGFNFATPPTSTDGIGIFVAAPGVIASGTDSGNGLAVTGATRFVIPLAADTNILTSKGGSMSVHIILQGKANKYTSGTCTVKVTGDQTISSSTMTTYTIPFSNLTLVQSCGQTGITTVASALADGVAEIHVQAIGTANLNTTVQVSNAYPSGLTFGAPIQFIGSPTTTTTTLAVRPLPSIYTSGTVKAINYSGYRTAGGPTTGEVPTDAQIIQDLTLLNSAGYTLLRLFDTDISHENILRVAAANFPTMKFHLGIYLQGIATANQPTCTMPANDTDVQNGIREANTYSNVVTVSVGNETSFFSAYMPVTCLAQYITTVKQAITQPVTADDDYTFYIGSNSDTILPLLDFVSIHTYPMSNPGRWTSSGYTSATAMMAAALANAQSSYTQVASYIYAHGAPANLPIVIGETGWKHMVTNSANTLETCCANPINAKMYFDSMNTWQTTAGTGPKAIFYFEAFDEPWKGTDDGWGLWDNNRTPLYALCGTAVTAAPACTNPIYLNATFH